MFVESEREQKYLMSRCMWLNLVYFCISYELEGEQNLSFSMDKKQSLDRFLYLQRKTHTLTVEGFPHLSISQFNTRNCSFWMGILSKRQTLYANRIWFIFVTEGWFYRSKFAENKIEVARTCRCFITYMSVNK